MTHGIASGSVNQGAVRVSWRSSEAIALVVLGVPLLIALIALAYRSTLLIAINYNEGWNAYHAAALVSGGKLHYPAAATVTNNYPPLSFLINAILRRLGNDPVASAFGAMLFTAYSVVQFNIYVGIYDPQWLAHAVM